MSLVRQEHKRNPKKVDTHNNNNDGGRVSHSVATINKQTNNKTTSIMLPNEILAIIFSYLYKEDVGRCYSVSKTFLDVVSTSDNVWKQLATIKYGKVVADSSIYLYRSSYKSMMLDDNRKGAIPTRTRSMPIVCDGLYNKENSYYCCLIVAIQWHRSTKHVRIYIDARGETDLRHPRQSSIAVGGSGIGCHAQSIQGFWTAEIETPGHYKGYLAFPDGCFHPILYKNNKAMTNLKLFAGHTTNKIENSNCRPGSFSSTTRSTSATTTYHFPNFNPEIRFCYGNINHYNFTDFESVPIFDYAMNVHEAFDSYTLATQSPFFGESCDDERSRWRRTLTNPTILDRQNPTWFV